MDIGSISDRWSGHQLSLVCSYELKNENTYVKPNRYIRGQVYSSCDPKWVYIVSILIFEVGSTLCAAAPNMDALIIGRAICGLGGSGMYIGLMTLLSVLTTTKERATYLGLTGLTWGTGTVVGPIVGGAFAASSVGWRWSFWINLLFGAACAPVYVFLIPSKDPRPGTPILERLRVIDVPGTILLSGILVSGLMAVNFGGTLYPWDSTQIIVLFLVSGFLLIIWLMQQGYYVGIAPETRSFPLHFFKNRQLTIIFIVEACASTLTFLPIYFLPLYFQLAKGATPIESGVQVLPLVVLLVVTISGTGLFTSYFPRPMPWFLVGSACGLAGAACLYTVDASTDVAKIYGYSILIGFGAGCFVTLCFAVAQAQAPRDQIPAAVGFVTFSQLAASGLALSIANTLFLNLAIRGTEQASGLPASDAQGIVSGTGSDALAQLDSATQQNIVSVIVSSMDSTYIIGMICGGVAVILSLFLDKGKMTL